ncbi:MAG: hypothetical protein ACKVZ0_18400 [Gemmatimonadales bacterium]
MPPTALEDRVVSSLRGRGALRTFPGRWSRALYGAGLLAASLAAFFVGRGTGPARPIPTDPRWMLLLYEDESFQGPAPGREADYVEEYRRWAGALQGQGAFVDGAELGSGGGVLEAGGQLAPGETLVAGAGRLTGYFVISAPSLDAAATLAATSPHLAHRGRIAIRPLGGS